MSTKRDKVSQILLQIKQQTEELLDTDGAEHLTAEEIVVIATEITTSSPVTTVDYASPLATIDRNNVQFSVGEFNILLYGDKDSYEDFED